jgi:hypothetical protein
MLEKPILRLSPEGHQVARILLRRDRGARAKRSTIGNAEIHLL